MSIWWKIVITLSLAVILMQSVIISAWEEDYYNMVIENVALQKELKELSSQGAINE